MFDAVAIWPVDEEDSSRWAPERRHLRGDDTRLGGFMGKRLTLHEFVGTVHLYREVVQSLLYCWFPDFDLSVIHLDRNESGLHLLLGGVDALLQGCTTTRHRLIQARLHMCHLVEDALHRRIHRHSMCQTQSLADNGW